MHLDPESDLHWTAFLYVAGELSPDEASRFESRLADDQDARDAVAEAVELAGALAIVGPEFLVRRRPIGRRALVAASGLAAACIVLAIAPRFLPSRPDRPDASAVALAWSSLRADSDAASTAQVTVEAEPTGESEAEIGVDASTGRALPSWLITATSSPLDAPREED
jgi:hypothetical protein